MNAATLARWGVAVPLVAAAYVLGFATMAWVGLHIDGNPTSRYTWTVTVASYVFVGLPVALSVILMLASLVGHTFKPADALGVVGTPLEGLVVLRAFRRPRMAA